MDIANIPVLVEEQREFFNSGKTKDLKFRIKRLKKLKEAIQENELPILDALSKDLGKNQFEGYVTELGMVFHEIEYMLRHIKRFARGKRVWTPLIYFSGVSRIIPEPLGVVLIIAPWNYPFQLLLSPLIGAIAAGNCAVLKPSELSPNVSRVINEIIEKTFMHEYISTVEGGIEEANILLEQKFDHIFFTGSTAVGKKVMAAAAKNLTPVTLELGGKSPCIVDKNTDLVKTANRIVWGKFLNAGQTCIAPDYLFVHKEVKQKLLECIMDAINNFYGLRPLDSKFYGRIISEKHFDRLNKFLIKENILVGGSSIREEKYIAPTILSNLSPEAPVMQEEIFGPILPLMEYSNINDVIRFINSRPKPLALYVFSKSKRFRQLVIRGTSAGGVCENDVVSHFSINTLPFGGVGESGMGRSHGKSSFDTFSNMKSIFRFNFLYDSSIKYPPYKISLKLMKKIMNFL